MLSNLFIQMTSAIEVVGSRNGKNSMNTVWAGAFLIFNPIQSLTIIFCIETQLPSMEMFETKDYDVKKVLLYVFLFRSLFIYILYLI